MLRNNKVTFANSSNSFSLFLDKSFYTQQQYFSIFIGPHMQYLFYQLLFYNLIQNTIWLKFIVATKRRVDNRPHVSSSWRFIHSCLHDVSVETNLSWSSRTHKPIPVVLQIIWKLESTLHLSHPCSGFCKPSMMSFVNPL